MYDRPKSGRLNLKPEQWRTILTVAGWAALVLIGALLTWYGFRDGGNGDQSATAVPTVGALTPQPLATAPDSPLVPALEATFTPEPTQAPTAIPPTPTPQSARLVAGSTGVNIRGGPGINYNISGFLDAGAEALVIGRYQDWWQIQTTAGPGWVFGDLVTAYNTENVPDVVPPAPPPTAIPPTATSIPPTAAPTQPPPPALPGDFRGIVPRSFSIENAPGPFGGAGDIWFNFDVLNSAGETVLYTAIGTFVEETGQFQRSWTNAGLDSGATLAHRDHINQFSLGSGTYHLWLRICWPDGACDNMKGPVEIRIQ